MKLRITITGPKVHDVGYRYFLMSSAMANGIRMFEAHNYDGDGGEEVLVRVDGDEREIKAFMGLVETKRPMRAEVSKILTETYNGEVMRIGEYAQFCTTIQMNKALPLLLDIRDDLKEMKTDLREVKGDLKEVKNDLKEVKGDLREVKTDLKEVKGDLKGVKGNTDSIPPILEEIKGMRGELQPGFSMQFRQVKEDIRAIKERLGMP